MTKKRAENQIRVPPELRQLESVVGRFIEYWGFKKIHGRIWAHLYTSNRPLDSKELMLRLKVSKGLMSIAIRDLLKHEVIRLVNTGKHGVAFYETNPDLVGVISNVLREREQRILGEAQIASESLLRMSEAELKSADISVERVKGVLTLTQSAQGLLAFFLASRGQTASKTADQSAIFASLEVNKLK